MNNLTVQSIENITPIISNTTPIQNLLHKNVDFIKVTTAVPLFQTLPQAEQKAFLSKVWSNKPNESNSLISKIAVLFQKIINFIRTGYFLTNKQYMMQIVLPELKKLQSLDISSKAKLFPPSKEGVAHPCKRRLVAMDQLPYQTTIEDQKLVNLINELDYHIEPSHHQVLLKLEQELKAAQQQKLQQEESSSYQDVVDFFICHISKEKYTDLLFYGDKITLEHSLEKNIGYASTIGKRAELEDTHLSSTFFINIQGIEIPIKILGLFDGHGGVMRAKHVSLNLIPILKDYLEKYNSQGLSEEGIWNALKLAFVDLTRKFNNYSGTTANVCLFIQDALWTANIGDSRAVLLDKEGIVTQLSEDAKPENSKYQKAVYNRGSKVIKGEWMGAGPELRVNGEWACGRAINKCFGMDPRPKITRIQKPAQGWDGYYLAMGCDGLFDVVGSEDVGKAIKKGNLAHFSPEQIAAMLVFSAFHNDSSDNISVLLTPVNDWGQA